MKSHQLLAAMNQIDDAHVESAGKRLHPELSSKPLRLIPLRRAAAIAAAAAIILAASFGTAMAVSEDFRNAVFEFFRIEQTESVPEHDPPVETSGELITAEPEKILIGGAVEGRYVHCPSASHARNGVFYVCTDEVMMNSGNHYDVYTEQDGKFLKLEEHTFSLDYTILGNDFHVEFQWAEAGGQCVYTYIDSEAPWRKPNMAGPLEATLFWFPCTLTGAGGSSYTTNYPVLINLITGELTDILAGTGAEGIPDIYQAAISEDLTRMVLVTWEGQLYYVDIPAKKLCSVDELSGEHAEECALTDTTLTCWALEGDSIEEGILGSYKIWTIDLATMERRDLFSGIPATAATSHDVWSNSPLFAEEATPLNVAGLHFIDGFSTTSHWGNMYTGSRFAIEVDGNRNVYVIDLATGGRSVIEGFLWPEIEYPAIECIPSPDGGKLLIQWRTAQTYYDYIGVLDFARKTYLEFSRENVNDVNEHTIYWFDNESVIIATTDHEEVTDYYIYRLLD